MKYLLLSIIICTAFSCKVASPLNPGDESNELVLNHTDNQILTLILQFDLDTIADYDKITVYDKIITNGELKGEMNPFIDSMAYQVKIYSSEEKLVNRFSFGDPLRRNVEYVDDDGRFARKDIIIQQDYYPLRLNYSLDMIKLKVFKNIKGKNVFVFKTELQ